MMNFKHCLLALVMLIASPAWAQWTPISETDGAKFFLDFENIRKDNNRVKVWVLTNFSKPLKIKGDEIVSFRSRYEVDCKQEQIRVLAISAFSRANAAGTVFGTEEMQNERWSDPAPRTSDWEILKSACKAIAR
jgi:stringent starvation protein B